MKTRLSICIATYNREPFLRELINSIIEQADPADVQIAISDNASSDKTMELVEDYKKLYSNIVYFRWQENMGVDKNILKAVDISSGVYCWLVGSDDIIPANSIAKILSLIDSWDVFLFGRSEHTLKLVKIKDRYWLEDGEYDQIFDFSTPGELRRYFDACRSLGGVFSFISSIVIKRSKWTAVQIDEKYIGSAYLHVFVILKILLSKGRLRYSRLPLVISRGGNDSFLQHSTQRGLLDLNGYRKMADLLSSDRSLKDAFLGIMKYEHSTWHIIKMTAKLDFSRQHWIDWFMYMSMGVKFFRFPKWLPLVSLSFFPLLRPTYLILVFLNKRRRINV